MKIIPAIDIINGKCVRLTKGDYTQKKTYNENPLEVAKEFEANGIQYLHLVDLDGAKSRKIINHKILNEISSKTNLKIDFGGGLKSEEDVKIAFESGANQITGGTIAAKNRDIFLKWLQKYGSEKIILGADCNNRIIVTNAWQEGSELDIIDFIRSYEPFGIQEVISTDVSKDGMLEGPSLPLYKEILSKTNINLIASGGVTSLQDVQKLKEIGCAGVIIGKAIYEKKITLTELSSLC